MKSKIINLLAAFAVLCPMLSAETPPPAKTPLPSQIFEWDKLAGTTIPNGVRRAVFDDPTTTLEKLHCHITTLNKGENSGQPRLHPQEEVIIVKEGTIEAYFDGQKKNAPAGSIIFFAAGATTALRNAGDGPATYYVINYYPPAAPKP